MRALLFGALLGVLLLAFPSVITLAAAVLAAAAAKAAPPVLAATVAVRTLLPRVRRWAR
ncbi:hypothetical protein AB0958_09770 [Streptomyces sp. NPDC006655]|uniref:hypothetical protein n=1 Tax=Streptomyces sp. NPDC006655 TaxID=3156898 RepID=UPI00345180B7